MASAPSFDGTFVFGPTCFFPSFSGPILDFRTVSQKVRAKVRKAALNSNTLAAAVCLFDRSGPTMSPTTWEEMIGEAACLLVDDLRRMTEKYRKTCDERDVYLVERDDLKREVVKVGKEIDHAWKVASQRCEERDEARRAAGVAQCEVKRLQERVEQLKHERDTFCNEVVDIRAENRRLQERVKQLEEVTCKKCMKIQADNDRLKSVANEAVNHRQDAIARKTCVEQELLHANHRLHSVTTLLGAMNYDVEFNFMDGVTVTRR
jgi:uncharacterized protein (UPF0335 family)